MFLLQVTNTIFNKTRMISVSLFLWNEKMFKLFVLYSLEQRAYFWPSGELMKWLNPIVILLFPRAGKAVNNFLKLSHFHVLHINSPWLKPVPSPKGLPSSREKWIIFP